MGYRIGGTRGLVIGWGIFILKNVPEGTSLVVQRLGLHLPIQGVRAGDRLGMPTCLMAKKSKHKT